MTSKALKADTLPAPDILQSFSPTAKLTHSIVNIDLMRVLACFMVIVLHIAARNFYQFGNISWWSANFFDSLVRSSVPLFLMISGALLLFKEENLFYFLKKRIFRIIPALVFWSLVYLAWYRYNGVHAPHNWIVMIFHGPVEYHLWYLYAILIIYAFVPFLRKMYKYSTAEEKVYYIFLWAFLISIYPMIDYFFLGQSLGKLSYFVKCFGYLGYLFLGAWLFEGEKNFSAIKTTMYSGFFILLSILTMLATYWYSQEINTASEIFYDYFSPFVILMAVFLFKIILNIPIKNSLVRNLISQVSLCTLGIYCIHVLIINLLLSHIGFSGVATWWLTPVLSVSTLIISFVIINTMRRIKLFKYIT